MKTTTLLITAACFIVASGLAADTRPTPLTLTDPVEHGALADFHLAEASEAVSTWLSRLGAIRLAPAPGPELPLSGSPPQPLPASPGKIIVYGDGGAWTDEDREKMKKLVSEGVVEQRPESEVDKVREPIDLALQPQISRQEFNRRTSGGLVLNFPANDSELPRTIDSRWDQAIREFGKRPKSRNVPLRLDRPVFPFAPIAPEVDAALSLNGIYEDALVESLSAAFAKSGLNVVALQRDPVLGAVAVPPGQRLLSAYAEESGSPSKVLNGTGDLVDIQLVQEDAAQRPAEFGRVETLLERIPVQALSGKQGFERRVVGLLVSPEDLRLVRAAEEKGVVQAVRRRPGDDQSKITLLKHDQLKQWLLDEPRTPQVPPGSVVRTVNASQTAKFQSGDRVDVLVTYDMQTPQGRATRSRLILEGVPVFTISNQNSGDAANPRPGSVSLVLAPPASEKLALLERRGHLTLLPPGTDDGTPRVQPGDLDLILKEIEENPSVQAPEPKKPASSETAIKIFAARNARAEDLVSVVTRVLGSSRLFAATDPRTNSIVLSSSDPFAIERAEELLLHLDSEQARTVIPAGANAPDRRSLETLLLNVNEATRKYSERDAAAAKLARELRQLQGSSRQGRKSPNEERLRKSLEEAVQQSFAARQTLLNAELDALQARIASTRRSLELREAVAGEIVQRRVDDLLNPELEWDAAGSNDPLLAPAGAKSSGSVPAGGVSPLQPYQQPGSVSTIVPSRQPEAAPRIPLDLSPPAGGSQPLPRRIVVEDLDVADASAALDGLPGGKVTSSASGVVIVVDATDGDYEKLRADLNKRVDRARKIAEEKRIEEAERQKRKYLDQLTGLWQVNGPPASSSAKPPSSPTLVLHNGRAAMYEGNRQKRLWLTIVDDLGPATRISFLPLDGQSAMQGSVDTNLILNLVQAGAAGVEIMTYRQRVWAVPPEWADEMQADAPAAKQLPPVPQPAAPDPRANDDEFRRQSLRMAPAEKPSNSVRRPSDFLERIRVVNEVRKTNEELASRVGTAHPEARKHLAELERATAALDVLQKEYLMEMDLAERSLESEKTRLNYARSQTNRVWTLRDNGTVSEANVEKAQLEQKQAESDVLAAEAKLQLWKESYEHLFPSDPSGSDRTTDETPRPSSRTDLFPAPPATVPAPAGQRLNPAAPAFPSAPTAGSAVPPASVESVPQPVGPNGPLETIPVPAQPAVPPAVPDAPKKF